MRAATSCQLGWTAIVRLAQQCGLGPADWPRYLPAVGTLPEPFSTWFAARGWSPRPHQMAMVAAAKAGEGALLIAPTGGGKTLAGFLPSLIDLAARPRPGLIRYMDRVLLHLLEGRPALAPRVFAALFAGCPPRALVRFLNDSASPLDLAAVATAIPLLPTLGAAARMAAEGLQWPRPAAAG